MTSEAQQRFQDTARADYLARQVARHLRGAWRAAEQLDQQLAAHGTCYGVTGDGALKDGALKDGALKDGALKDGALKDGPQGNGALTAESSAFSQYLINTDEQYGTTARSQPPGTGRSEVLQALLARLPAVRVMLAEEVLPEKVPAKELDGGSVLGEQVEEGREDVDGEGQREDEGAGAHHGPEHPQSARGCAATGAAAEGASSRDTCGGESSENGRDGVGVVGQGAPAAARGGPYVRVLVEEEEEEEQEAVRVEGCGSGMERGGHGDARRRVCEGGITSSKATEPSLSEQLEVLLQHLRERHWYCYFCGCQYDNPDDLAASCPGLNEDVH
ncbi:hypothetical protein Vafri_12832 [Volvox africanus]|nr:hypothetical protein Vafri_12832 [Volvox africanus]